MDGSLRTLCVVLVLPHFFFFFFARGPKRLYYIFKRWVRICRSSKENSLVVVATFVPPRFQFQFRFQFFFYRGVYVHICNWRRDSQTSNFSFWGVSHFVHFFFLAIYVLLQTVYNYIVCAYLSREWEKRNILNSYEWPN